MVANAFSCDNCGNLIRGNDIRIELKGYSVYENQELTKMPKGYEIGWTEQFCSFNCLSEWAKGQQKLLDDYIRISEKIYGDKPNSESGR